MPFTSIVVPMDLERESERILRYLRRLARAGRIPVELFTACSPLMPEGCDRWELEERAAALRDEGVEGIVTVVHSDDPATAIVQHLGRRPGALLAMVTHARGLLAERLLGSVSEAVLARYDRPVLLFGPRAEVDDRPGHPTLVVAIDERPESEAVLDATATWWETFPGRDPWLAEVIEPAAGAGGVDVLESTRVRALAAQLQRRGVPMQWEVLHGRHPADALLDFADRLTDAVIALASERWTDPDRRHLVSVARTLARSSRHPVLVVPARRGLA